MKPGDGAVSDLHGLGPKISARLAEVGIGTAAELRALGAVGAYRRLKFAFPDWTTLNALWGLHAALENIHWTAISPAAKADLRRQLAEGGSAATWNSETPAAKTHHPEPGGE